MNKEYIIPVNYKSLIGPLETDILKEKLQDTKDNTSVEALAIIKEWWVKNSEIKKPKKRRKKK